MEVEVETLAPGDSTTRPAPGDTCSVHYTGWLKRDGPSSEFDSSRAKGTPFVFRLGEGAVIRGWEIALSQMSVGQRARVTVSAAAAYGVKGCRSKSASGTGVIPPHADLVFDIELLDVNHARKLRDYRATLDAWRQSKLDKFDSGGAFAAKAVAKHGSRDGYAAHLAASVAAKFATEEHRWAPAPGAGPARQVHTRTILDGS